MRRFQNELIYLSIISYKKLQEVKPDDVWNPEKRKWTKPSSQIGYKAVRVQEMFTDMKDKGNRNSGF